MSGGLIKQSMWLSPMGQGTNYDWAALEGILDGQPDGGPKTAGQHETSYWGEGKAAHFWGPAECPVRRPVAAIVDGTRQWKTTSTDSLKAKAAEYKRTLYAQKLAKGKYPPCRPLPLDDERILGAGKPLAVENRLIACHALIKGLYAAPLTGDQNHTVLEAAQEDLKAAFGRNVNVAGMTSSAGGTALDFSFTTSGENATKMLTLATKLLSTGTLPLVKMLAAYRRTGIRPSTAFTVDPKKSRAVCRMRLPIRADPADCGNESGLGSPLTQGDKLHRGSFVVKGGMSSFRKSQGDSSFTNATPSSPSSSPTSRSAPGKISPTSARSGGYTSSRPLSSKGSPQGSPVSTGSPTSPGKTGGTVKDRKKALLGSVLKKTKQELSKIESEVPQVASTYALQQKKQAITQANVDLARDRTGNALNVEVTMAKDMLKPPCEWVGAVVRTEGGRKYIENFEMNVVDFNRQTRMMVGRARIQSGKMDMTYQCKTRVLVKDAVMTIEMLLDNGGVLRGKFEKKGQLSGTFKFPNGSGTFKLTRSDPEN